MYPDVAQKNQHICKSTHQIRLVLPSVPKPYEETNSTEKLNAGSINSTISGKYGRNSKAKNNVYDIMRATRKKPWNTLLIYKSKQTGTSSLD